uniref:Uncharacterized protein n=1 Tax=Picea sitchensis TaxID=3332 RepID=A9P0Y5_PICSI|nr:unknown [Picea sitchensis]
MDSQTPRKRGREPEALPDSIDVPEPKRFHGEETDRFLQVLQLVKSVADEEEEEYAPSDELVSGVMRKLEEEIAATRSTSILPSYSGDNAAASDIYRDHEGQTLDSDAGVYLSYLLNASDDELGIPPSSALDLKDEVYLCQKETSAGLSVNPDLKSLGENWQFEDDFENYQQLMSLGMGLYEDAWNESQLQDYMNKDFISPGMLFDDDFSETWRPETACDI